MCEYKGVLHKVLPEIRQVCILKIACYLWKSCAFGAYMLLWCTEVLFDAC